MPAEKGTASVAMLYGLLRYASGAGVDVEALQQAIGLRPGILDDPEARIPTEQFRAAWKQVVLAVDDRDFGLHLAEAAGGLPGGGIVSLVMANCPTLRSALIKLVRYHDLTADFVRVSLREQGDSAYLSWRPVHTDASPDRHQSEAVLAMLAATLRNLAEDRVQLVEARFVHKHPGETSEHRRIFGCPLVFGQPSDELVVRRETLARPIHLANPTLLRRLERLAEDLLVELYAPDTWSDKVALWLGKTLVHGDKPSLKVAAHDLALSGRHLQNKLREEGTSYRALLDQTRKEMAVQYLCEPGLAICDIAFLLGFSDQSSFNHAFRRWTGSSPKAYRNGGERSGLP
jgi:AraC-like DNA-binding protein